MDEKPIYGCFQSHKRVASLADEYLVLEDDAMPTNIEISQLAGLLQDYTQFDIIYLGGTPIWGATKVRSLYEGKCIGTYAMIVRKRARDMIMKLPFKNKGIDVELASSNLRTAFCDPPFFVHANTISDIGSNSFTKSQLFADFVFVAYPLWRKFVIYKTWLLIVIFIFICIRNRRILS